MVRSNIRLRANGKECFIKLSRTVTITKCCISLNSQTKESLAYKLLQKMYYQPHNDCSLEFYVQRIMKGDICLFIGKHKKP